MTIPSKRFGAFLSVDRALFLFLVASALAHLIFLGICHLAPKKGTEAAAPPKDCVVVVDSQEGLGGVESNAALPKNGKLPMVVRRRDDSKRAADAHSSSNGRFMANVDMKFVIWPCCGEGCPGEIVVPEAI